MLLKDWNGVVVRYRHALEMKKSIHQEFEPSPEVRIGHNHYDVTV